MKRLLFSIAYFVAATSVVVYGGFGVELLVVLLGLPVIALIVFNTLKPGNPNKVSNKSPYLGAADIGAGGTGASDVDGFTPRHQSGWHSFLFGHDGHNGGDGGGGWFGDGGGGFDGGGGGGGGDGGGG